VGSPNQTDRIFAALDGFEIELPSWGFANTGTRFGKFVQETAAVTTEQKLEDAGQVHRYTGCCPAVALHVLWDFPAGLASVEEVKRAAARHGVRIGSINPNLFQDQIYKHGSFGNPDPAVRQAALRHCLECVGIQNATGSRDLSLWFADGSSYPGTQNIRRRKGWFVECLQVLHACLAGQQRMLVEYKPFEPFFYHTDLGDWGMAYLVSKAAGPRARVLVDTGHHYQAQNIEQIVAWLLSERMLGGFHFNDRRYADDDLTMGSIDPYQIFRIFHEISMYEWDTGGKADIAYMVDQSHNLKNKVEEMIQTAVTAQELYAKAALVDHAALSKHQNRCDLVEAEECLKEAFATDVRPAIRDWRRARGLPDQPLRAFRESGYLQKTAAERAADAQTAGSSYA
jgi:L-rhamnose isomerase/sugar isomerase